MAKKAPPPLALLKKPAPATAAIHGGVRDSDKGYKASDHARLNETAAKVKVKDGKLLRSPKLKARSAAIEERNRVSGGFCLCGCGRPVANGSLLSLGHYKRIQAALSAIASGEMKPEEVLSPKVVRYIGPWVESGDGLIPSKNPWSRGREQQ